MLLWTTWFVLIFLLAAQTYLLSSSKLPVPEPVREQLDKKLADYGLRMTFEDAGFDLAGHIILENVEVGPVSLRTPLVTARSVYVRLDPWSLIFGRSNIEEISIDGLDLRLPASESASGIEETLVDDIDLTVIPRGNTVELLHFTGYVGSLAINASGVIQLPAPSATTSTTAVARALPDYVRLARQLDKFDELLAALASPRLDIKFIPAPWRLAAAQLTFHTDGVDLSRLPGGLEGHLKNLKAEATVPIGGHSPALSTATGSIGSLELPDGIKARALDFAVQGVVGASAKTPFDLRYLNLQLASLSWRKIEVTALAATISQPESGRLAADLSVFAAGSPWRVQADVAPSLQMGTVKLDGFIGDDTLSFAGGLVNHDLNALLAPADPAPVHAEATFLPGFKLSLATGRIHSGPVRVGGAHLDETATDFVYDGDHAYANNLVLRLGNSLAHGSYEMDTHTMDFRFLLTGKLKPEGISSWFHEWWSDFWKTFDFTKSLPEADVDVQGRWGDLTATHVFVQADGTQTGIKGAEFNRVRTRLFIRPQWFDILHFDVRQDGNYEAAGQFSRLLDLDKNTWKHMVFDVESGLPLTTISKIFTEESKELLEPYGFSSPPALKIHGRVDSVASEKGKHETIDLGVTSKGLVTYHGYPLHDLRVQARIRDDLIDLPALEVNFAGGAAAGEAKVWGIGDARRLSFDVTLKNASIGTAMKALAPVNDTATADPKAADATKALQQRLEKSRLDITMSASGLYGDFYSFTGGGRAMISGAELAQLNVFGPLSEALRGTFLNFSSFSLNTVEAPFRLNGSSVRFDDLRLTGPSMLLEAKGNYGLKDRSLDFKVKVHPYDESRSIVGNAVGFVLTPFSKAFEVKLQGTQAKPSWIFAYGPTRLINSITGSDKPAPEKPGSEAPAKP